MQRFINFCEMSPELTRRLNDIAKNCQKGYTEWVDEISLRYQNSPFWWFTPFAGRHTASCSCFYEVCLLKLILEVTAQERPEQILVPSVSVQKAVECNLTRQTTGHKIKISVKNEQSGKKQFLNVLKRNDRLHAVYMLHLLKKRIRIVQEAAGTGPGYDMFREKSTIVCVYRIASQFQNGTYQDRYFQGLTEHTDENIVYFTQLDFHTMEEGRMLAGQVSKALDTVMFEKLVAEEDFKKVRAYSAWCLQFQAAGCRMDDMDVTALVNHAVHLGASNLNAMYGILKAAALLRLTGTVRSNVARVIDWYEGQPSSNGMIYMFRKKYPDIPTIAYVMSPCPENNLALYPSGLQVRKRCVPEYYGVQGCAWEKMVRQFEPDVKCIFAPSFRYQNVFHISYEDTGKQKREGVLLVLSFMKEASAYLLRHFFKAAEGISDMKIFIKNHPCNAAFQLTDYGVRAPAGMQGRIRFVTGDMDQALQNKEMVIMTETSSSLEVTLRGIFTVMFASPGRLQNVCFPDDVIHPLIAWHADDLRKLIRMRRQFRPDVEELVKMRERTFMQVNEQSVSEFLQMQGITGGTI